MRKLRESDIYLNKVRSDRAIRLKIKSHKPIHKNKKKTPYKSLIISLLKKPNKQGYKNKQQYQNKVCFREEVFLPKIFSVIHDPDGFLKIISSININSTEKLREIHVDHSKVKKLDLAAESILDLIIMELKKSKRSHKGIIVSGVLPDDEGMNRYIRAIGLVKNLDIKEKLIDSEQDNRLRIFRMRNKSHYSTNVTEQDWKGRAATDFVYHINNCLRDHGKKLKRAAEGRLSSYIGEILNNAEDHSGYDESVIVGYLDNASANHICEIAIFNFGKTIAETFHEMPENSYTNYEISEYIESHTKKSLFSKDWSKDDLLTLVALQGHISSKNYHKDQDRGQGTVDLIEFFQKIHRQCVSQTSSLAEMAILSGSTHIYFDGKYKMSKDLSGRKIIAFNVGNDLSQKPDFKYIRNLGNLYFPGTIISIRFPMKSDSTEPLVETT